MDEAELVRREYMRLVQRIRLIDPEAADFLLRNDIRKFAPDFRFTRDLGGAFSWSSTPQGHGYWSRINMRLLSDEELGL